MLLYVVCGDQCLVCAYDFNCLNDLLNAEALRNCLKVQFVCADDHHSVSDPLHGSKPAYLNTENRNGEFWQLILCKYVVWGINCAVFLVSFLKVM